MPSTYVDEHETAPAIWWPSSAWRSLLRIGPSASGRGRRSRRFFSVLDQMARSATPPPELESFCRKAFIGRDSGLRGECTDDDDDNAVVVRLWRKEADGVETRLRNGA